MSLKKLTILFTPLDGWGHINACHGLAEDLKSRGHRIVFAIDKAFEGKLIAYGFEECLHGLNTDGEVIEYWPLFMEQNCHYLKEKPIVMVEKFLVTALTKMFADNKEREQQYEHIINKVKPDLIVTDNYICMPTITNAGIPWVWLFSAALHQALDDNRIPPAWSGLPLNDCSAWHQFREQSTALFSALQSRVNDYCIEKGAPKLADRRLHPLSPYLNIYLWPKEFEYEFLQPMDNNWVRVENFIRTTHETFEIPKQLLVRPSNQSKLIFLSMGSFGCANIELMTRLTTVLAKSQHRFIISKGPVFEKHSLPPNMWGQRFLPQTAILPLVDLVISHGGTTVTESYFYGKPVLVLPLFGDQLDVGQRVVETKLGICLNPFYCTDEQLLNAIDTMAADTTLAQTIANIGKRMRESKDKTIISDLIEKIATK